MTPVMRERSAVPKGCEDYVSRDFKYDHCHICIKINEIYFCGQASLHSCCLAKTAGGEVLFFLFLIFCFLTFKFHLFILNSKFLCFWFFLLYFLTKKTISFTNFEVQIWEHVNSEWSELWAYYVWDLQWNPMV